MKLEIQFEVEPVVPDTSADVKAYFDSALQEALTKSELQPSLEDEPRVTFSQHLPLTKEQVEIATILLAFTLKEAPYIWQYTKAFLDLLVTRLSQKSPVKINFELKIDGKKIRATGLSPKDAVKVITEKYEAELRPRK